jgi:hypothetical protein
MFNDCARAKVVIVARQASMVERTTLLDVVSQHYQGLTCSSWFMSLPSASMSTTLTSCSMRVLSRSCTQASTFDFSVQFSNSVCLSVCGSSHAFGHAVHRDTRSASSA